MGSTGSSTSGTKPAVQNKTANGKSAESKSRTFIEPSGAPVNKAVNGKAGNNSGKPVSEPVRLAFGDWLYQRLTKYFDDIQKHILEQRIKSEDRIGIEAAVDEFLDFLFTETEVVDRRFRVNTRDVIKVGTFHENLDIISFDQVQYCIVMDDLSRDNIQKIERVIVDTDELHRVYLTDNCAQRWDDCIEKEGTSRHWIKSDIGLASTFFDRVDKAVEHVKSKSRASIYRKQGRLDLFKENAVTKNGASVELKFTWNAETVITVTLIPCLRYDKILEFIDEDSTLGKAAHKILRTDGKLLLQPVAGSEEFFQWHFGHVEKEFMKECVSDSHKRVYQMIRFLVQGYNRATVPEGEFFTELTIKMLVIIHGNNCVVKDRMADCVMAIINDMQTLLKAFRDKKAPVFLQTCFCNYQNILPPACRSGRVDMLNLNIGGLEQITNHLINEVGCTPLYDFDKSIKTLVPLNAFVLNKDYKSRKNARPTDETTESNRELIDAVGNQKFTVQF